MMFLSGERLTGEEQIKDRPLRMDTRLGVLYPSRLIMSIKIATTPSDAFSSAVDVRVDNQCFMEFDVA